MIFVLSALSAFLILLGLYELLTFRKKRIEQVILGQREKVNLNLPIKQFRFVLMVAVYAVAFFFIGFILIGGMLWGILMAAVGAIIPFTQLKEHHQKQIRQLEKELEEALYQGTNVLRGGGGLYQFLEYMASDKTGENIRPHFQNAFNQVRDLGLSPMEAVRNMANDLPEIKDLQIMATSLEEAQKNGTDMSQVVEMFADDVRNRRLLREEIVAKTTQGQMTAFLLLGIGFGVPFLLKIYGLLTDNPTFSGGDSLGIQLLSFVCYCMMIVGFFIIRRMIRV